MAGGVLMHDFGTLRLTAVRVLSNTAVGGDAAPGANGLGGYVTGTFYVQSGTVQIEQSAFVGNELLPGASETAPGLASGGGLAAFNGTVRITNTTFAGNTATEGAALTTSTPITLTHVTVAHNTSTSGPALRALSPYLWLYNSVVAHNAGGNCDSANQASGTANLQFPGSTCGAGVTVDDPLLAALAEHDGMPYLPLLPGSPARDAAIGYCPSVDQLGAARPLGPACDLGAVEAEGFLFMPFIQR